MTDADVIVIGGGFAGLSAAVTLADAGRRVVVVEAAGRLGGRASTFTDHVTGERVDNGQHVLFGCYRETYAFLRRIGTDHLAPLAPRLDLNLISPGGQLSRLVCPALSPPWHLVAGVLQWSALSWRDRLSTLGMRRVLSDVRRIGPSAVAARVPPNQTVDAWLAACGQSEQLCEWLWRPLAFAALNQSPQVAAAAPFVRVVGELFGPRHDDAAVGLAAVPLDELYALPARQFLEARNGAVRLGARARVTLDDRDRVTGIRAGDDEIRAAAVISAVPWHACERLWNDRLPDLIRPIVDRARLTAHAPIVTANIWLDARLEELARLRFVGFVEGPMHWVFDRGAIIGQSAGHLSIVASGAEELASMSNDAITAAAVTQLRRAFPEMRARRVVHAVVVRERRATFSLAPGQPARPPCITPLPGFFLAGDWTDTDLPATVEGAVLSGHRAAKAVLDSSKAG